MVTMTPDELNTLWKIINSGGIIGLAFVFIWAFMRGNLWPREMVEKALEKQFELGMKTAELMAGEIKEGMAVAVRDGISKGIVEGHRIVIETQARNKKGD